MAELGDLVDYWVPFNEPTVFVTLTYCAGAWPPGFPQPGPLRSLYCLMAPTGNYSVAMDHVALAHRAAYRVISARRWGRRLNRTPVLNHLLCAQTRYDSNLVRYVK